MQREHYFMEEVSKTLNESLLIECQDLCHTNQTDSPEFTHMKRLTVFNHLIQISKRTTTSKTIIQACSSMDFKHMFI